MKREKHRTMATIQLSSSLQALVPPHGLYGAQEKKENNGATHQVGKKKRREAVDVVLDEYTPAVIGRRWKEEAD